MTKRYVFDAEFGEFWKFPVYVEFSETEIKFDDEGNTTDIIGKGEITVYGKSSFGDFLLGCIIKIDHISYRVKEILNELGCNFILPTGFTFKIKEPIEVED